eukprot:jgi/Chrzof1/1229/Cz01g45160.t1
MSCRAVGLARSQMLSTRPSSSSRPASQHARGTCQTSAVSRTAYSYETKRLMKCVLTRQAIKTVLNYLSETNGELHYYLHNYVSEHPIPLSADTDADEWLVALATTPYTKFDQQPAFSLASSIKVQDPRRSSVPSAAAAAAVMQGGREVSPRYRRAKCTQHVQWCHLQCDWQLAANDKDKIISVCSRLPST